METNQIEKIWSEWEIEELLGEGASGKVYKAKRKDIEDTYSAIKIIEIPQNESEIREAKSEGMGEEEVKEYFKGFVDDLVEEITLLESLKEAKGIVGISDYKVVEKEGTIGWTIYIRMELLTGINSYLENQKISEEDIINIGLDLSEALEYCEKLKIIHRDIKPENIFISRFGEYKLGDFGIARRLENTSSIMSKKGTYLYMPPEVYKGEEYDKTVDLYSLGLVMYKLGNDNRTPFLPKAPNPITYRDKEKALMMRMQGENIPKPENMSEELYKIIEKMIAYNPKERYQSAKQVKDDLEKIKEKNVQEYTGTVNIFTHKSTPKIEKTELVVEENKIEPTQMEEKDVLEEKVSDAKEIEQKINLNEKSDLQEDELNKINELEDEERQESQGDKKDRKKIIILIIAIVLIIAVVVGIKIFGHKEEAEIVSEQIIMPNLLNLTKEEAEKLLEGKELEITYQDTYQEEAEKGKIVYQSIVADEKIEKGSKIIVFINNLEKDQIQKIIMPRVIDLNIDQAMEQLLQMGLQVEKIEENNETVPAGIVFEQDIVENTEIEQGGKVILKVSLGKKEEQQNNNGSTKNNNNSSGGTQNNNSTSTTTSNQNNNANIGNTKNSNWSGWVESLPAGVNASNADIETKTQYSYREKSTTTSSSSSLSGWTRNGAGTTQYSGWGASQTTTNKPTTSDVLQIVSTKQITTYQYHHWKVQIRTISTGNVSTAVISDTNIGKYEGQFNNFQTVDEKVRHALTSTTKFNEKSEGQFWGDKCPTCGTTLWYSSGTSSATQYTYQTRTKSIIYNYYKWSDWSSYSDTPATANSTTEVRTKTLYRYKTK